MADKIEVPYDACLKETLPALRSSGLLLVSQGKDGKPNAEWLTKLDAIRQILTSGGRTLAQGALAWIWGRSEHTIPIPGFRTVAQVEENCAAMQFGPLSAEQMGEIDALLER